MKKKPPYSPLPATNTYSTGHVHTRTHTRTHAHTYTHTRKEITGLTLHYAFSLATYIPRCAISNNFILYIIYIIVLYKCMRLDRAINSRNAATNHEPHAHLHN